MLGLLDPLIIRDDDRDFGGGKLKGERLAGKHRHPRLAYTKNDNRGFD